MEGKRKKKKKEEEERIDFMRGWERDKTNG